MGLLPLALALISVCGAQFDEQSWTEDPEDINTDPQFPPSSFSDFSISFPAIHRLSVEESEFYQFLKLRYLKTFEKDGSELTRHVRRYVRRYESEALEGLRRWRITSNESQTTLSSVYHPFLIFQMLRRLAYDFRRIYPMITEVFHSTAPSLNLKNWPKPEDVALYGELLVVLPYFYDFNMSQFGSGQFDQVETAVSITAVHALELAYISISRRFYTTAIEFLEYAIEFTKQYGGLKMEALEGAFENAIREHDKNWVPLLQDNFAMFTSKIGSTQNFTDNRQRFVTKKQVLKAKGRKAYEALGSNTNLEWDAHNHMSFCNGDNFHNERDKSQLYCWYHTGLSRITPFKMELLSRGRYHSDVTVVHDFITWNISTALVDYAFPRLKSSKTFNTLSREPESGTHRRAATVAWVDPRDFPTPNLLHKLDRNIEVVTGLNVRGIQSGELLQIASNLPGGHFVSHHDTMGTDEVTLPNGHYRLATFMIYLSKTVVGGRTAFTYLGIAAEPEPLSAVFWFNHREDGSIADQMYHGGCPVVLGDKWVATKWIRGLGNFNKFKCHRKA